MEMLKNVWDAYKDKLKQEGNMIKAVSLDKPFELKNEHEIHLTLANDVEVDGLKTIKVELLEHLRNGLQNDYLDLFTEVKKEIAAKKAYTNSDKFKAMMEKSPGLAELKDRLGLDPDI